MSTEALSGTGLALDAWLSSVWISAAVSEELEALTPKKPTESHFRPPLAVGDLRVTQRRSGLSVKRAERFTVSHLETFLRVKFRARTFTAGSQLSGLGDSSLLKDLEYFPSWSTIDGLAAALLAPCEMRNIKGILCVSWPEFDSSVMNPSCTRMSCSALILAPPVVTKMS
ncbi:hypothetical protein SAY87_001642 [Trapa incisa]|uniref:Uncharacterized protein n=1 Tax=Trapa incisa TaxID=236973 RepID=A0AAN7JT11_9MYRT|nr:hypothetical protein SAY87_001642 [Trapa incisa]